MGSATAYHLARRGAEVTLVDQFSLGHDRGSSHGLARITRHSYADPEYARLMLDAFAAWRQLEADAGRSVYIRTGGVSINPRGVDYVAQVAASLTEIGVEHRRMTGAELNRTQSVFHLPADADVVFEPDAGLLLAAEALRLQVELAKTLGGSRMTTLENQPVRRIELDGERPALVFDDHVLKADRLIVTAGSWTPRLLPELAFPLTPTRQQVLYFRPTDPEPFALGRFPVWIYKGEGDKDAYYGMPALLGSGVKAARHGGPVVDPDRVDREVSEAYRDEIRGVLRGLIPALGDAPIDRVEVCLYTMDEGENFRVGLLPGRRDVVVASPCSGHGFKFSCLIGRVLADLAVEGATTVAIDAWRIDRG